MTDPFVSPPFKECPQCHKNSLGVLSIQHSSYSLRCAECGYPRGTKANTRYDLPELKKIVIYLDQFMISNMVKSLIPDFSRELDSFYLEAFKKLDRLSKLQLIICPDSNFHQDESELSKYPEELKRVYELLSHGVSFKGHWEILRFQVLEHLENWNNHEEFSETRLTIEDVTFGSVNAWQDKIQITMAYNKNSEREDDLRQGKKEAHSLLQPVFNQWKTEKGKLIEAFYAIELGNWDSNFSEAYDKWQNSLRAIMKGKESLNPLLAVPTPFALTANQILEGLKKKGKKGEEIIDSYRKFLSPESLKNVPYIRIYSMTFAKLAWKISQGLKVENVKSSFMSDSLMMATILPFCDAVFTEKQLSNFFKEAPLNRVLKNNPKIYSLNEKQEFLDYLDHIEENMPSGHMKIIDKVYGPDWAKPYVEVFEKCKK